MLNGVIIIDKPAGWTSHDVVAKLRGVLGLKRIGHGGTLDPMATGVLPVFVGRATRAADFAAAGEKEYRARMRLGLVTDTQDITGRVLEERPVSASPEDVQSAAAAFTGEILQTPPMYSAIKIKGRKLYEIARAGGEVEREPRRIFIKSIEISPSNEFSGEYDMTVVCSKGTYIRTLCHDIGLSLGCGACMTALRRTRVGGFLITDAVSLENASPDKVIPVDRLFSDLPELFLGAEQARKCRNGVKTRVSGLPDGRRRVYDERGFLMLGEVRDGELLSLKNFFEP